MPHGQWRLSRSRLRPPRPAPRRARRHDRHRHRLGCRGRHRHGSGAAAGRATLREIEALIETGRHDEAAIALEKVEPAWSSALAKCLTPEPGHRAADIASVPARATLDRRPGYLVINPLNVPRRAAVILPDAALDLRPEGPLRAAQFTEHGVYAVVDLPAFGFAWVPKEADLGRPPAVAGALTAKGRRLRNESMEIEIDAATGGIRSVATAGEPMARLGQQLVVTGLLDQQGKPLASQMRSSRFDIDYGGPALLQATAAGTIVDPRRDSSLASFTQRYRLWSGRPILEIEITLSDLDISWLERASRADPWSVYLACRWAWPDPICHAAADDVSGRPRSRKLNGPRPLMLSISRLATSGPHYFLADCLIIASTAHACSTPC